MKLILTREDYKDRFVLEALGADLDRWGFALLGALNTIGAELKTLNAREDIDEKMRDKLNRIGQLLSEAPPAPIQATAKEEE